MNEGIVMRKVPMTRIGAEKLRAELHQLKTVDRPRIVHAIAEARGHGDLRENAEYHAAKEQQGFTEGRIREIEHKLGNAEIIDITTLTNQGKVIFGATVNLINLDTDQTVEYQIVGEDEADLKSGKISITSPIARALIGKQLGDSVDVNAPNGVISYEIEGVEYI
jgi:transcription elongation factor GreA